MQTLQITGQIGTAIRRRYERLHFNHGSGNEPSLLTGHSEGVKEFPYIFNALPDRIGDNRFTVTDPEDSTLKSWADYLYDFHGRRMVDGEAFNITDPQTGSTMSVVFVDDEIEFKQAGKGVYSATVMLRQWRDPDE